MLMAFLANAQKEEDFYWSANCEKAYNALFELKYYEALTYIDSAKVEDSTNGVIYLLEDYADMVNLLSAESDSVFANSKGNEEARL